MDPNANLMLSVCAVRYNMTCIPQNEQCIYNTCIICMQLQLVLRCMLQQCLPTKLRTCTVYVYVYVMYMYRCQHDRLSFTMWENVYFKKYLSPPLAYLVGNLLSCDRILTNPVARIFNVGYTCIKCLILFVAPSWFVQCFSCANKHYCLANLFQETSLPFHCRSCKRETTLCFADTNQMFFRQGESPWQNLMSSGVFSASHVGIHVII